MSGDWRRCRRVKVAYAWFGWAFPLSSLFLCFVFWLFAKSMRARYEKQRNNLLWPYIAGVSCSPVFFVFFSFVCVWVFVCVLCNCLKSPLWISLFNYLMKGRTDPAAWNVVLKKICCPYQRTKLWTYLLVTRHTKFDDAKRRENFICDTAALGNRSQ